MSTGFFIERLNPAIRGARRWPERCACDVELAHVTATMSDDGANKANINWVEVNVCSLVIS
jgi:hypothetical protein